jgi:UDP-N-acetyl-alpha-D-muramoyl-L-alanyl-L-glutamate epimerase
MDIRREEIESFHATDFDFDPSSGTVYLRYRFSPELRFEERFELGGPLRLDAGEQEGFERILRLLHAAAGTSYYKAFAPRIVSLESGPLTASEHRLVSDLYDKGLREFAFTNRLDVPLDVDVQVHAAPGSPEPNTSVRAAGPGGGIAVPIGGGKDSIVVLEALRGLDGLADPIPVAVNPAPAAMRIAEVSGLELVPIKRMLDPKLFELNRAGALNGHVPVTAIVSLAVIAAGYAHGYATTVMSLESSADEPTRRIGSTEINHQWSKSSEFEYALKEILTEISTGIRYGSALRDLSELDVASCFAGMTKYHQIFRSCNRAFALDGGVDGWCNDCPKCRFVFLMLATSLDPGELVHIFGADLFRTPGQIQGFRDLLDTERKPFECVGTLAESISAFNEVIRSGRFVGAVVLDDVAPLLESRRELPGEGTSEPHERRRSPDEVLDAVRDAVGAARTV